MRPRVGITTLIVLWLAVVSPAFSQKVSVDWDHHVNFANYHSYSWGKVISVNSLWDDRVTSAVDDVLAQKGWTKVHYGGDVTIMAFQATRAHPTMQTFYTGFGGWHWRGFGEAITTVQTYKKDTLVIDMFDTSTERLIWHGYAEEAFTGKAEKDIKNLQKAVRKLLEHFPPPAA